MFDGVVLIGGSASVGKTTLSALLAERVGDAEVVHIDDMRRDHPDVVRHLDRPGVWDSEPSTLLGWLLEETASLRPTLLTLIERVREAGAPAIVEGEGIEPALVEVLAGDALVRALYVIETSPDALRRTFSTRPSAARFLGLTTSQQDAVVEMNRLYGAWLRNQLLGRSCQRWVASRPWTTLPDRAAAALALG